MTVTWRIDLRIHAARPERVDAILVARGDEWEGLDLNAAEYPADRPTTLIRWSVDQLACSASFGAFAADLATVGLGGQRGLRPGRRGRHLPRPPGPRHLAFWGPSRRGGG